MKRWTELVRYAGGGSICQKVSKDDAGSTVGSSSCLMPRLRRVSNVLSTVPEVSLMAYAESSIQDSLAKGCRSSCSSCSVGCQKPSKVAMKCFSKKIIGLILSMHIINNQKAELSCRRFLPTREVQPVENPRIVIRYSSGHH